MTPAQLIAAILQQNTIELNLAASPYNQITILDVENYVALGLVAGVDTAESLLKIVSPVNTPVYENAGFLTDDYSSPDFAFLASPVDSITKDLPHVTGGTNAIAGNYTVYVKQKVVASGTTYYVTKTLGFTVCVELMKTAELTPTYNCDGSPATFTITDNTDLSGKDGFVFDSVSRTIEIAPPFGSGLSPVTGSSSPFTQSPLWTGTYGFNVEGFITFINGTDTIIVRYAINGEKLVVCNDILCKMYCCLKKLRTQYYDEPNAANKEIFLSRWTLGIFEYNMAVRARLCGDSEANLSSYIDTFYKVTKCDPNCDCCDDTDAVAPVINDCGCTNGENGKEIELQKNGTWVQWRYVGDLGWNNLYDTSGSVGPAGADGVSLLLNDNSDSVTVTDSWETWAAKTATTDHTNDSKNLVNVGDQLVVYARFKCITSNSANPQKVRMTLNGSVQLMGIYTADFYGNTTYLIEVCVVLSKLSNTTCSVLTKWTYYNYDNLTFGAPTAAQTNTVLKQTLALLDTSANDNVISAYANDGGGAVVTCEAMSVELIKLN